MSSLRASENLFEGDPKNLNPSSIALRTLCEAFWGTDGNPNPPGFINIIGLGELFSKHGLSSFVGEPPVEDEPPQTTQFLQRWTQMAYRELPTRDAQDPRSTCLFFSGYGPNRGRIYDRGYEQYGGPEKFFLSARLGIQRFGHLLQDLARRREVEFEMCRFFEGAIDGKQYGSLKLPHFDSFTAFSALERKTANVNGGNTVIVDVGRYCKEAGANIWDILVPYAPPAQELPIDTEQISYIPYVNVVLRPEVAEAVMDGYSTEVPNTCDSTVVFNNAVVPGPDGRVFAYMHGATPVEEGTGPEDPVRNLLLSHVLPPSNLSEVRRLMREIEMDKPSN